MRNEGPAWLYASRKQLVMALTYRSSVTLPVWAASHRPVPVSNRAALPNHPSLSQLAVSSLCFDAFCVLLWPCPLSDVFPSSHPDNTHFFYFGPLAHIAGRCLPKFQLWQGTAVHQQAHSFVSLVETHTHSLSLNIQQLQNHFGSPSNKSPSLTSM